MFLQAGSPAELRAYMAQYPDSRCIAGGTDIMPVQNRENDHEAVFIDISGAAALHRIVSEDGVLSIGAAATFAEIERNTLLRQYAPVLCLAASQVGSPQIRNLGTIGGNVAHGSPAADTLPVLAMLDAEVRLYSATEGTCRDIPVDTFITGPGQTLLRPGEYIEALRFSPPEASWRMAYEKVGRRNALAISRLSACCATRWEGQRLTGLRLALGAVFPTPRRLYAAEALLLREQPSPAAEMQAAELVTQAIVAAAGRRASASSPATPMVAAAAQADLFTAAEFDADKAAHYAAIAFGCPSMGAEQLEESEFEPMFTACRPGLRGKKIALFGSYGWGDGEWMSPWEDTCRGDGAELVCHFCKEKYHFTQDDLRRLLEQATR